MKCLVATAALLFVSTHASAETASSKKERLQELIKQLGQVTVRLSKENDRDDFVSPFSKLRADKKKFLNLRGLNLEESVKTIRSDGVDILFIDTERALPEEIARLNQKYDERVLVQVTESFVARKKLGQPLAALYILPGEKLFAGANGRIDSPLPAKPFIIVDWAAENVPMPDRISALQHEYVHHLFESRYPARKKTIEEMRTLSKLSKQQCDGARERLLKADQDKTEPSLDDRRKYIIAYVDALYSLTLFTKLNILQEYDALFVQLVMAEEMGMSIRKRNHLVGYFRLQMHRVSKHLDMLREELNKGRPIAAAIPDAEILGSEAIDRIIRLMEEQVELQKALLLGVEFASSLRD